MSTIVCSPIDLQRARGKILFVICCDCYQLTIKHKYQNNSSMFCIAYSLTMAFTKWHGSRICFLILTTDCDRCLQGQGLGITKSTIWQFTDHVVILWQWVSYLYLSIYRWFLSQPFFCSHATPFGIRGRTEWVGAPMTLVSFNLHQVMIFSQAYGSLSWELVDDEKPWPQVTFHPGVNCSSVCVRSNLGDYENARLPKHVQIQSGMGLSLHRPWFLPQKRWEPLSIRLAFGLQRYFWHG